MKRFAWIAGALAGVAACYLAGALVAWDANAGHWSTWWRLWCFTWAIPWAASLSIVAHETTR